MKFLVSMELSLSERLVAVKSHLYVALLSQKRSFKLILLILEFARGLARFLKRF